MKVNKYKVLATLVRSFFDAFSSGIIDNNAADKSATPADRHTPKAVKQMMLDHYEHIAPVFMDTMFFPLAAMNYEYSDIERVVRNEVETKFGKAYMQNFATFLNNFPDPTLIGGNGSGVENGDGKKMIINGVEYR